MGRKSRRRGKGLGGMESLRVAFESLRFVASACHQTMKFTGREARARKVYENWPELASSTFNAQRSA